MIALDMYDDPEEVRPHVQALMAQILGPIQRLDTRKQDRRQSPSSELAELWRKGLQDVRNTFPSKVSNDGGDCDV